MVEIGLVVLEKEMKMWKIYDNDNDNNDNDNDDDGQRTNFDQRTFGPGKIKTALQKQDIQDEQVKSKGRLPVVCVGKYNWNHK